MSFQEKNVQCIDCRTKMTNFTVDDRLCNPCLHNSTCADTTSAFKIEFLDSSENKSNTARNLVVKIEDEADTSSRHNRVIKLEPTTDDYRSVPHDPIPFIKSVSTYRSGHLPDGVVVQIENDTGHGNDTSMLQPDRQTRNAIIEPEIPNCVEKLHSQLDQSVLVKQEPVDDDDGMVVDSQNTSTNVYHDFQIKEEITVEEPQLTEVTLGPVERKPLVKCQQCEKSFLKRAALYQHVKRMHLATKLSCDVCGSEFANTDRLGYHKRTAHKSPQLQCPQCPKKFALPNGLKHHILTHSAPKKDRRPECEICGRKFKSRVRLQQHMERKTVHMERKCPVCEMVILGYERFEEHMSTHPKPPKTPHRLKDFKVACRYCDHKTTSRSLLRKHNDECHAEEKTVRCRICFVCCNGKELFEQHIREQHEGKQRQCDICLEGFVELAELDEHKEKCLGRQLFQCTFCQINYVKQEALTKHIENHNAAVNTEGSEFRIRSMQKIFTCTLCGDDRGYEEDPYNAHVKTLHNGYHILCPDCGAKFRLHKSFVNHRSGQCTAGEKAKEKVSIMYAPIITQCLHCPRAFKNRWRMEEHVRKIHKAKPADCDICGLKLASASLVKSHKLWVHTEANFKCPHCEKKFVSKYYFQKHLLTHQEGSYLCEECGGKYKSKPILKLHIKRVHNPDKMRRNKAEPVDATDASTNVESVKCEVCSKDFKGPVRLRIHMKIHDPNRKQYDCPACEAKFVTRIGLRQHMANDNVHHEATCAVCSTYFRNRDRYEEHMLKHASE
ncbi:oocyte zinc finger protein XlCOF6-like isoform X2 [Armigeres subalbatus]|uniref:oocyte zinc finger protein XlCOF6-like isoform X2 n=1 Tax=Armigeres subalbatus TaxID=124917 RepID=UPI002ED5B6C4